MLCPYCNSEIPDDSQFCPNCGNSPYAQSDTGYAPQQQTIYCPNCGASIPADSASGFCGVCGQPLTAAPVEKKKRSKKLPLIIGIAVALVCIVVVVLLLTGVFSSGGPLDEIDEALTNVIDAGSFTMEYYADGDEYTVQVEIDPDNRELTVYAEEDGEFAFAIYDGYYLENDYYYNYYGYEDTVRATNIEDELDQIFDAWEEAQDTDISDIDWKELLDGIERGMYSDAKEYVDFDSLTDCLEDYSDQLNSESWLEEHAGYSVKDSKNGDVYSFEPDLYDFLDASLNVFESAFKDSDDYDRLVRSLRNERSELRDMELSIEVTVDDGYLTEISMESDGERLSLEITDIGETEIDTNMLSRLLREAS